MWGAPYGSAVGWVTKVGIMVGVRSGLNPGSSSPCGVFLSLPPQSSILQAPLEGGWCWERLAKPALPSHTAKLRMLTFLGSFWGPLAPDHGDPIYRGCCSQAEQGLGPGPGSQVALPLHPASAPEPASLAPSVCHTPLELTEKGLHPCSPSFPAPSFPGALSIPPVLWAASSCLQAFARAVPSA